MIKNLGWIAAMGLAMSLSLTVSAQDTASDVTEHDFRDADQVRGDRSTPYGELLRGRHRLPRRSLIRLRTSFSHEMLKSIENL